METTICYDPHCSVPPCDVHPVQAALAFGLLPCAQGDGAVHASRDACVWPPGTSTSAAHAYTAPCTAPCTAAPVECRTAAECDGLRPWDMCGWYPPLPTLATDTYCCSAPCRPDTDASSMAYGRALPATPSMSSNDDGSTDASCMTPTRAVHEPEKVPTVFSCAWDECGAFASTLEALAAHVQRTHHLQASHWQAMLQGAGLVPSAKHEYLPWTPPWSTPGNEDACVPTPPVPRAAPASELLAKALDDLDAVCGCPTPPPGEKKHACGWENCTERFNTHAALTEHITQAHVGAGKAEYACRWVGCARAADGRTFSQRQKVLRHIQTHTGDRPYVCATCHRRFSEPATLTQHMRTHTNERPYRCTFPGCTKSFSVPGSLTIHRRTHTGDKPFACPYEGCGKVFAESSNLNKHIRVHATQRRFACAECHRTFSRPDQLQRHQKTHALPRGPRSSTP